MQFLWLDTLSGRERLLLGLGAVMVAVATVFLGLIEPLVARQAAVQQKLADANALATWLDGKQIERARIGAAPARIAADSSQAPGDVAALETALKAAGFGSNLSRIAPQQGGRVELDFAAVSYRQLVEWMLQSGLAHRVEQLDLRALDRPDRVDATLIVSLRTPEPDR